MEHLLLDCRTPNAWLEYEEEPLMIVEVQQVVEMHFQLEENEAHLA